MLSLQPAYVIFSTWCLFNFYFLSFLSQCSREFSGKGKKGAKAEKAKIVPKFKNKNYTYGHGADDRLPRLQERANERTERMEKLKQEGILPEDYTFTGKPLEDDPVLAGILSQANFRSVNPLEPEAFSERLGGLEEPKDIQVLAATRRFANALNIPEEFRDRVNVVPTTDDVAALTDIEAEDPSDSKAQALESLAALKAARSIPVLPSVSYEAEADSQAAEMAANLLRNTEAGRLVAAGGDALGGLNSLLLGPDGEAVEPHVATGLHDSRHAELIRRRMYGATEFTDDEAENAMRIAYDSNTGTMTRGVWGDDPSSIPRGVLDELSTPYDFYGGSHVDSIPDVTTEREAAMTPEERVINEQRKRLRDVIEKPLPIATRPLWPLHALITGADVVRQVVSGGVVDSTRCMVVVGNGQGGIGFGMAKHKDPFACTKKALQLAQRDMIHVSTHKGQLFHDLIGRKNNVYVAIRTLPAGTPFINAAPLITDVFELAGVKHASAKVFGSHRRNPYIVTQALFDAFNHHESPEESAAKRGLRMVWATADRVNPRTMYPFSSKGPRFPAANDRFVRGNMRP